MVKGTTFFPTLSGHTARVLEVINAEGGTLSTAESNLISATNNRQPGANYIVSLQIKEDRPLHYLATGDAAILTPEPQ
jgi:hypothetical protein